MLVADAPGLPTEQVRAGVEGVLVGHPTAELLTNDEHKAGIGFGWALTRTPADQGLDRLAIPPGQLAVVAVAGAVIGVLPAVNPSRRAARIDILRALQAT